MRGQILLDHPANIARPCLCANISHLSAPDTVLSAAKIVTEGARSELPMEKEGAEEGRNYT